ncbi:MAG: SusC/RagA family TonB-linked outer membrane protein [Flavobacteriaceae bacterium]|nr:MAG: SusC/RagA family TonB-linked outer membrane protein [Flavobacteriaceae bacterium]
MIKFSFNFDFFLKKGRSKQTLTFLILLIGLTYQSAISANLVDIPKTINPPNLESELQLVQEVKGTVKDSNGQPLPGVTVIIKGTSNGTQTDFDGNFKLDVSKNDVLVFTYMGMKTKSVIIGDNMFLNVTLEEDSNVLDEVIIVGYGTQSKATLTGSVANVKTEEIAEIAASNMTSLLAGRMAGVSITSTTGTPGVSSNLTIRTRGTWNNANPIYVIDGIVKEKADFDDLDVNEVAEISILKDAASTAVYGARASNGVILVRTKTGKIGAPTISYSTTYNFEKPTKLPKMMSGVDIVQLNREIYDFEPGTGGYSETHWEEEDLNWLKTVNNGYGYDYLDEVYIDPASNRHALNFSGGSEHVKYFVGGSIFKQTGFLAPLKYGKNNLRANLEVKLTDNLTANVNISTVNSKREKFFWPYDWGNDALPDLWKKLQTWQFYQPIKIDGKSPNLGWLGNIDGLINESGYWKNRMQSQSAILSLTYKVPQIEGLSVKGTYAYDNAVNNIKQFNKKHTVYDITGYTKHNYSNAEFTGTTTQLGATREGIYQSVTTARNYQLNAQVNYTKRFGDHNVDALFVYEQSEGFNENVNARRFDFPVLVRDQWNQTSGAAEDSRAGGWENESGRVSYVGRLNYDYKSKYIFSGSFRYDGSMIFKPSERWGFFPTVSAGWVVSKEDFFNVNFIDHLKFRASYGTLGNDRVDPWRWQEQYVSSSGFFFGESPKEAKGIRYGGITNQFMTWETSHTTNLGFDLSLTNNIIMNFDYWSKKTTDILGSQLNELPSTVGGNLPNTNYGEMKSSGFEIALDYENNINNFDYYIGGNFGYATNEVVNISQAENIRDYQNRIGRSWNYIIGYKSAGILRTQEAIDALPEGYTIGGQAPKLGQINYQDLSGVDGVPDGKIDSWDQTVIADNAAPTTTFGFKLGGKYKGFSVDAFFQGAGGYKKILSVQTPYPWTRIYGIWEDYWSPSNTDASMPNPDWNQGANQWTSTFWLKDANYVRLKNLNIGYSLPKSVLNRLNVKGVKIFVAGTNIFTVSEFKAYDVELSSAGSYPNMKNYSVGMNITL